MPLIARLEIKGEMVLELLQTEALAPRLPSYFVLSLDQLQSDSMATGWTNVFRSTYNPLDRDVAMRNFQRHARELLGGV